MNAKELNDILLHAVPNGWAKQSYFQGWYFEMKTYKETCAMFEQMENDEQVYEGKSPSKKLLEQMTTMTVMSGNEREENPPGLPTPRRAAMAS